jgi:hypothetical protein
MLGRPLPFPVVGLSDYADLCLGWYLGPGRADAGVVIDEAGTVVGYVLVCTHEDEYDRWMKVAMRHMVSHGLARLLIGALDRQTVRFFWNRALDAFRLWRRRTTPPMPVHAHFNLDRSVRSGRVGYLLRDHIDERCRLVGAAGWYGEMNALSGKRQRGLERLGGEIVRRETNDTLSRLLSTPVERLTVVRTVETVPSAPALDTRVSA